MSGLLLIFTPVAVFFGALAFLHSTRPKDGGGPHGYR